jgi:hypothetical protein
MKTPVALLHDVHPRVDVTGIVRANGHAVPTADAPVGIDQHNPIFSLVRSFDRANRDADRVFTVVAEKRQKGLAHVGIATFFDLFHPGTPDSQGDGILPLAGYGASVAANAFS